MTTSTICPPDTITNDTTDCTIGTMIAFDDITQPGCYVCNATGHLVRVNESFDANAVGNWWNWSGSEPLWFTCVSTDPNCGIGQCRINGTNAGVDCCF